MHAEVFVCVLQWTVQVSSQAMLSIIFLSFAFIYQLSTTFGDNRLNYYDPKIELGVIQNWYNMVKSPLHDDTSMTQLDNEAKSMVGQKDRYMDKYLKRAKDLYRAKWKESSKCVSDLTRAECLVVMMFTDEFYREYNQESTKRNWKPYRVYTTLLTSALKKLAKFDPIPKGKSLYRGVKFRPLQPTSERIFWKAFTSTSLNYEIAKQFAGRDGTVLEFKSPASIVAGKVGTLTKFPQQEEVILMPFEAFDVVPDGGQGFHFKTSKTQELLKRTFRLGKL